MGCLKEAGYLQGDGSSQGMRLVEGAILLNQMLDASTILYRGSVECALSLPVIVDPKSAGAFLTV